MLMKFYFVFFTNADWKINNINDINKIKNINNINVFFNNYKVWIQSKNMRTLHFDVIIYTEKLGYFIFSSRALKTWLIKLISWAIIF